MSHLPFYEFLALVNGPAAARTVQQLTAAPLTLLTNPRNGERLDEFEPRDVRRLLMRGYEIRYEIARAAICLLRLWHSRDTNSTIIVDSVQRA